MVVFPNCKINLGLHVLYKRTDLFHELETVFLPIHLKDALEVLAASPSTSFVEHPSINYSQSGLPISGKMEQNLCIKAYDLLKKDFPKMPSIQMHLHKVIPMGAGLGGGSADAAFMLSLLNQKFHLSLSTNQLEAYALKLGSDCPFFILNKPCYATGRGERMEEITLDLTAYQFVVVHPNIHISTGWAFGHVTPRIPLKSIKEIIQQPIDTWRAELINDFEAPAINEFSAIGDIKQALYREGAIYSSMTGSGSTVFGIFKKDQKTKLSFPSNYFVYQS